MARTDNLTNYLTDLSNAIKEKKGDTTPIAANDFDTEIMNLSSDSNIEINNCDYLFYKDSRIEKLYEILSMCKNVTSAYFMFRECKKIPSLDLSEFDTSKIENMSSMFAVLDGINQSQLTSLDLSSFDTSNVKDMSYMFNFLKTLTSLDVSSFNTSQVTSMSYMFHGCSGLTSLDVSSFNTSQVTSMSYMFHGCSGLTSLDLSSFNASKVQNVNNMFNNTKKLTNLNFMSNLGRGYTYKLHNYSQYTLNLKTSNLTYESIKDVIEKLYNLNYTYVGGQVYNQKLEIGTENINKLTEEDKLIAINKGWTIS